MAKYKLTFKLKSLMIVIAIVCIATAAIVKWRYYVCSYEYYLVRKLENNNIIVKYKLKPLYGFDNLVVKPESSIEISTIIISCRILEKDIIAIIKNSSSTIRVIIQSIEFEPSSLVMLLKCVNIDSIAIEYKCVNEDKYIQIIRDCGRRVWLTIGDTTYSPFDWPVLKLDRSEN